MKSARTRSAMRTLALGILTALAGCAFAPSQRPPAQPSPSRYTAEPTPTDSANAGDIVQHFSLGARAVPDWWRLYGSDTLNAWVDEGLTNNPSLEASQHTLEAAHELLRAKLGSTLPSLDAGVQSSRQREPGIPNLAPKSNLYNVYAGQLTLSYNFDLFGAERHGVDQAAAQVDEKSYEVDAARRVLAANIVVTAINAASLAEQMRTSDRLAALAHEQVDLAERAYRLGAASHSDLLLAQQMAAGVDASLPPLRTQAEHARHALAVLMGRTPDQAPINLELSQLQLPAEVPVSVPSDLLRQRPDVLGAEAAVRAASAKVGVATANLFPQLSLSASLGTAGFHGAQLFTGAGSVWGAGLSLAQPIFHGGALKAERKAAIDEYNASLAQYRQTVLDAFQNVADTLTALNQDALTQQATQTEASTAQQSFNEVDSRFRLGAQSYPVKVTSEQRWQSAKLAEIQARASRLADTAALFQAMGTPNPPPPTVIEHPLGLPATPSALTRR